MVEIEVTLLHICLHCMRFIRQNNVPCVRMVMLHMERNFGENIKNVRPSIGRILKA